MKERIGISLIYMVALFTFLPSTFAKGGWFAVSGFESDGEGGYYWSEQIYYDNVFFVMLTFGVAYLMIVIPFLLPKIGKLSLRISTMIGSWWVAGFAFEAFNFTIPSEVLNSSVDNPMYFKFAGMIIVGLTIIMIRETWTKVKKQQV